MLLSLVDPTAPFVPVSCNDDTITAICFAPRCLEVISGFRVFIENQFCTVDLLRYSTLVRLLPLTLPG